MNTGPGASGMLEDEARFGTPVSYWVQFGTVDESRGWKLYVSSNAKQFSAVLAAVSVTLKSLGVCFKTIASPHLLQRQNAGEFGFSQIGKNVVAYAGDANRTRIVAMALREAVRSCGNRGPEVPFARPLDRALCIYYRYGSFHSNPIDDGGFMDQRHGEPVLPPDVLDPLKDLVEETDCSGLNKFLTRYPIFRCLRQTGKGGVFLALNVAKPYFEEVIVKLGRRNGCILDDGRDGFDLLRHEYDSLGLLRRSGLGGFLPHIIDYAEFDACNCLVLQRFSGQDLMEAKLSGNLHVKDIKRCLDVIKAVNFAGFSLGDAKIANFVREGDSIMLVDLESLQSLSEPKAAQLPTFYLKNVMGVPRPRVDWVHFLVSVLYDYNKSGELRVVDPLELLNMEPLTNAEEFAHARLRALIR